MVAKKYHINPKTGNPNICRANDSCPFGGADVHFPTKEAALKGYEAKQSGSFPETKPATVHPSLLNDPQQLSNAPLNAVLEMSNGLRFVRTGINRWETSSEGGMTLTDEQIIHEPKRRGIPEGLRVVPTLELEPNTAPVEPEKPRGTLKASLVENASYEEGLAPRRYFLLLNHRNPEQLKAASGKVKDQKLVEDVQAYNEVLERKEELLNELDSLEKFAEQSKTDAQKAGYLRAMTLKKAQLEKLQPSVDSANELVKGHMKRYAKQLVIHRRSLDSLERLANEGVKASPPKVKDRIYKLQRLQENTNSVGGIRELINGNKPANVLEAAREFGNPIYIKQAEKFAQSAQAVDRLNNEASALQRAANGVSSQKVKDAAREELQALKEKQAKAWSELESARDSLKLFHADIQARWDQEQDIERELKALVRLSS